MTDPRLPAPDDLPSDGPACPLCGGGPLVTLPTGTPTPAGPTAVDLVVCKSCARIVGRLL